MAIFKRRFPSPGDSLLLLGSCAFPVFFWSILTVMYEVPAWILRLDLWDVIGVISYTQAFALLESIVLLVVLIVVAAILPARWLRAAFVAKSTVLVFLTAGWAAAAQYHDNALRQGSTKLLLLWALGFALSVGMAWYFVHRSRPLQQWITRFVWRLQIVSFLYLSLGLLGLIIVALRNL